jgi:hypothetical protein
MGQCREHSGFKGRAGHAQTKGQAGHLHVMDRYGLNPGSTGTGFMQGV